MEIKPFYFITYHYSAKAVQIQEFFRFSLKNLTRWGFLRIIKSNFDEKNEHPQMLILYALLIGFFQVSNYVTNGNELVNVAVLDFNAKFV